MKSSGKSGCGSEAVRLDQPRNDIVSSSCVEGLDAAPANQSSCECHDTHVQVLPAPDVGALTTNAREKRHNGLGNAWSNIYIAGKLCMRC